MDLTRFADVIDAKCPTPELIRSAGANVNRRFVEFFTAEIRNPGTRAVYARAVSRFCEWCDQRGARLEDISPIAVAAYVEELGQLQSRPTVKLHLSAIRRLFDYLVSGHVLRINPAATVRGPKHVAKKGRTPVLTAAETRYLLDSIDCSTIVGLRDRAVIGVMVYSFARVSAATGMNVADCFTQQRRMWFRLHEKGGKLHDVPAHHNAEAYVHEYIDQAGISDEKRGPLFRTVSRRRKLTLQRMSRSDVLRMIKRRAQSAGLNDGVCCHTFRATGITTYLENGGSLEHAQRIAAHESVRTTKLYDRTCDTVSLDEIERIVI